ncbi:MAG: hypothetical protein RSC49_08480 [Clostridium sp.]
MKYRGIGYILDLLKISPTVIGRHLNVDRTLISKWKNGSRRIDPYAVYFDKLLEFIVQCNVSYGARKLEEVFSRVYGEDNLSYENMVNCLRKFIVNNENIEEYSSDNIETGSGDMVVPITIYESGGSKKEGFLEFLDRAIELGTPCKICLVYVNVFEFYMNDGEFKKLWKEKITRLLYGGCSIDIVFSSYDESRLLLFFSDILLHNNLHIYQYNKVSKVRESYSVQVIEGYMVMFGLMSNDYKNPYNYAALYRDRISVRAYTGLAYDIRNSSSLLFKEFKQEEILESGNRINLYDMRKNHFFHSSSAYCISSIPSYLSMGEELFIQVMEGSGRTSREIEIELEYYRSRRKRFFEEYNQSELVVFMCIDDLKRLAQEDEIIYAEDDTILSPRMKLTNSQFKQHIRDSIDMMLITDCYNICLTTTGIIDSSSDIHCWCKRNQILFIFDRNNPSPLLICEDISFVGAASNLFEQIYEYTPKEYRDKESVSCLLSRIVGEAEDREGEEPC